MTKQHLRLVDIVNSVSRLNRNEIPFTQLVIDAHVSGEFVINSAGGFTPAEEVPDARKEQLRLIVGKALEELIKL